MDKVIELAHHIHTYNLFGKNKLPSLKLTIIHKKIHAVIVKSCLSDLQCIQAEFNGDKSKVDGYLLYRSTTIIGLEVHLINSLEDDEAIQDGLFLKRKKVTEKLREVKDMIFLYFEGDTQMKSRLTDRSQIMELKRVDTSINRNILWKGAILNFCYDLIKIWEAIARFELMSCLQNLKIIVKQQSKCLERQLEWKGLAEGRQNTLSYGFKLVNISRDYLVCSLEGYYSRQAHHFFNATSVHWQVMDLLEDLWKVEGDKLNRQIQRMPLSYIGQSLKMSDYHSIGGFLPEDCFLRVFKPLLQDFAQSVNVCLQGIKFKVIHTLQVVYDYYFAKTTVREAFLEVLTHEIEIICDNFLHEVQNAINSHISYVYAPAEAFWEMRNIKSNLYSPEQQVNIEIKYIGKIYVKRVYESIRESIPRYIGQGLMRKVSRYISSNSLNHLLEVTKRIPFQVCLTQQEIQNIKGKEHKRRQCDKLVKYFSLKVNSTYAIKNLEEKMEVRWKQMYAANRKEVKEREENEEIKEKGVVAWMKRLFRSDQKQKPKRSRSNNKQAVSSIQEEVEEKKQQKEPMNAEKQSGMSDKMWILALNTSKKIDDAKIVTASCQGFPPKLRPSIWYWLSKRVFQDEKEVKLIDILSTGTVDAEIIRQIEKDLSRTPPPELFHKKMRSSLRRVLQAYSIIDEQIKYTQGMNFIAAIILSTLIHWGIKDDYLSEHAEKPNENEIQQKAFTIFRCVMLKKGLRKMMFIERQHIADLCFRIDAQIKQLNPTVWKMIDRSGFSCEIIFGPILISGLSTWSNSLLIGRRILDLMLGRGFSVLHKVIAGVAAMSETPLSKLRNEQIYDFLRNKALDYVYNEVGDKGFSDLFLSV